MKLLTGGTGRSFRGMYNTYRSQRPLILFHQLVYHKALSIGASDLFKYVWLPGVFGWGVRQGWRNCRQGELPLGVVGRCLSPRRRASGLGSDCRSMTGRWMRGAGVVPSPLSIFLLSWVYSGGGGMLVSSRLSMH